MEEKKGKRSFAEYTPEELRELSRRGGVRSGERRQERKKLREELEAILSSGDAQRRLCTALIDKAMTGNVYAFQTLRDSLGERPKDQLNLALAGDMAEFKRKHKDEILQLWLEDSSREKPKYGSMIMDLLTYQERKEILMQELMNEGSEE